MSFTAEGWAWEQECKSSSGKLVLVCLGWFASKDGANAFPSIPTICKRTQLAENTVRKALKELIAAGLIEPQQRKAGNRCLSTEYRLTLRGAPLADLLPPPLADLPPPPPIFATTPLSDLGGNLFTEPSKESKEPRAREAALEVKSPGDRKHPANGAGPPRCNDPRVQFDDEGPYVGGWMLPGVTRRLGEAAGIMVPLYDRTVIDLLCEGYEPDDMILAVNRIVERRGRVGRSMHYYAPAIREQARAVVH